jgi:serine/threonine protein kinase
MGTVWHARDEVLDRDVAIKEVLVHPGLSDADRDVLHERTKREARATARLSHPGIVIVHDVIEDDGRPWIVMEFVRARSLQEIVDADGPLPPALVAGIGRQLIGALRTAHAAGILHRDVKPANVLLLREAHEDRAVLTDFGIAQVEGDATLTQTGLVMGSPAYIAPERARGDRATPATDLWALGATLYAACDGRPPHERTDAMSTLAAVLTQEAPPPRNAGPLTPVLMGLLHQDPAERLTGEAAADRLTEVVAGPWPAEGRTPPVPSPTPAESIVGSGMGMWAEPPGALRTETRPDERWAAATRPGSYDLSPPVRATASPSGGLGEYRPPLPVDVPEARRGRGINSGLVAVVALLAGAVVVLAGFLVLRSQDKTGTPPATQVVSNPAASNVGASPSAPSPSSPSSASSAKPSHSAAASLPAAGWQKVSGPGYSLRVPSGWHRIASSRGEIWRDSHSPAFVQVDHTGWKGDAYQHWVTWEPKAKADGALPSYQHVGLTRVSGLAYDAADLEFTYVTPSGTAMHAMDRGVRSGGRSFAVFISIPVSQWKSRADNVDNFLNSFRP